MFCDSPVDWIAIAAWVAIAVAIGAPYLSAWRQDVAERKRDREALGEARSAALALICVAARRLKWLADAFEGDARYTVLLSGRAGRAIATDARSLASFSMASLRDAQSIASMAEVQGILGFAESYCLEAKEMIVATDHSRADRDRFLSEWASEFRAMGKAIGSHATAMAKRHTLPEVLLTGTLISEADVEAAATS
jgi:hypothetical protein